jgi:hypothetical protein
MDAPRATNTARFLQIEVAAGQKGVGSGALEAWAAFVAESAAVGRAIRIDRYNEMNKKLLDVAFRCNDMPMSAPALIDESDLEPAVFVDGFTFANSRTTWPGLAIRRKAAAKGSIPSPEEWPDCIANPAIALRARPARTIRFHSAPNGDPGGGPL